MSIRVLVIAPHADDEILGAGGTIYKHIQSGDVVSVVVVCDRLPPTKLSVDHLRDECIAAVRVLGVTDNNVHFLGMDDEYLDNNCREVIKKVEPIYCEIRPHTVYYCHHDDVSTDHCIVNKACGVVCRQIQPSSPERVLLYEIPSSTTQSQHKTFKPNHYSILTDQQLDIKIKALLEYKSELREYPNPRSPRGLETYSRFRGMECNDEHAEAFQLVISKE